MQQHRMQMCNNRKPNSAGFLQICSYAFNQSDTYDFFDLNLCIFHLEPSLQDTLSCIRSKNHIKSILMKTDINFFTKSNMQPEKDKPHISALH